MKKNKILARIDEIISISQDKELNPPVELVLSTDGNYIYKDLYEEYSNLIELKKKNKLLSELEQSKYDQLVYIKDKIDFMRTKGEESSDSIKLLEEDIEEYSECIKLYNELSYELSDILKILNSEEIDEPKNEIKENPEIDIEKTVQLPILSNPKITIDDYVEDKKDEVKLDNSKLLQDLADIDKILGNLNISSVVVNKTSYFSIGDILSPIQDVNSYNDEKVIANKDSYYRVISFVSLDDKDNVINSSNDVGISFETYCSQNKDFTNLFVLSSMPKKLNLDEWKNRDITLDLSNCVGSFEENEKFNLI